MPVHLILSENYSAAAKLETFSCRVDKRKRHPPMTLFIIPRQQIHGPVQTGFDNAGRGRRYLLPHQSPVHDLRAAGVSRLHQNRPAIDISNGLGNLIHT